MIISEGKTMRYLPALQRRGDVSTVARVLFSSHSLTYAKTVFYLFFVEQLLYRP
jgi:hypothetical protein